jgi:hypothetical protein
VITPIFTGAPGVAVALEELAGLPEMAGLLAVELAPPGLELAAAVFLDELHAVTTSSAAQATAHGTR